MIDFIRKIVKIPAISGREKAISDVIKKEITPYVDNIYNDNLGNLIAFKKGISSLPKKIMLAAHMDEIGFIVNFIDDSGFIRVSCIGGINLYAAAYSNVLFEKGIKGVIMPEAGTSPADYKIDKFYVDIGAKDKKEAEKKVKIGDFLVIEPSITKLCGKRLVGRPFDDRIGCIVLCEIAKRIETCINDTYFVFTVQEEVGLRGATTAAYHIMPDYAIAYDVTGTGDCIDSKPMVVKLGKGAAIKIKDSSVLCDVGFVEIMKNVAKDNKIDYQLEILEAGGTDTAAMQRAGGGAIAGAISIPSRYIHSAIEMIDLKDVEACIELSLKLLAREY